MLHIDFQHIMFAKETEQLSLFRDGLRRYKRYLEHFLLEQTVTFGFIWICSFPLYIVQAWIIV